MFESIVLPLKNLKDFFNKKYYVPVFKNSKNDIKKFWKKKIHQIKNLFEVNLDNGLNYFYLENYRDAKIRFFIMNFFWKKNSCVYFNLGRVYFFLKDFKESFEYFNKSLVESSLNQGSKICKFFDSETSIFYQKKIDLDSNIFYIPTSLQKEKYDYSIDRSILYSFNRIANIKNLSSIFNHYIWLYKNSDPEIKNLNFLDLGSGLGELGEVLREEYQNSRIDGIDLSRKLSQSLKEYQDDLCEDKRKESKNFELNFKLYNRIKIAEMHDFLIENIENLNGLNQTKKDINHKSCLYDVIFSLGTFGEFGQFGTALNLCEINLKKNGLLIFYVYEGENEQLEFRIFDDYFCYNLEYINSLIENNGNFSIEFGDSNMKINDKNIIFVILKKIN